MHAVDRVVIHRLDRLSRSLLGCASLLKEFRERGIGLVIVTAPELGHAAQDSFMLNILASFADNAERAIMQSQGAEVGLRPAFG
jgi:DNA invertase Pin-like site-specific DNA recombinase